ncbi:hypothetical protein AB0H82_19855 [Streptomyces sp. NPDC050732]|uniref:hypothetical protein n=1 Tax=Streptomyces sp. NPDC050732 TaxID=3154632 RepID=UPI0034285FE3
MSREEAPGPVTTDHAAADDGEQNRGQEETPDAQEQRQNAWAARRDLIEHSPSFASSLVGRDQYGVSGGHVQGNVVYQFGVTGGSTDGTASGPIPQAEVDELEAVFQGCASFEEALTRLRAERVIVLSGGHASGRRCAAMMLLSRLGIGRLRHLEPRTSPASLHLQLDGAVGYVMCDLVTSRSRPLRRLHLLSLREHLERTGGHLVITVEPSAALGDVPSVRWEPPSTKSMLRSHVTRLAGADAWARLQALAPVNEFLARERQPGETAQFSQRLAALDRGEISEDELAAYGEAAVVAQVNRWLTEEKPDLLDKAFLISLAAFDGAPYAVTAELGDKLFALLQKIQEPNQLPCVPVFGSSRSDRLLLARANGYMDTEVTEWGAVTQFVAAFKDDSTARVLLREVWTLHPSARPALVGWIKELAKDGRPLVRTRAAAATALLATADLPSALALLIEPWADAKNSNAWLTAANALTLSVLLHVPTVPAILHGWCTGDQASRRWTALRAYGLLGPVHHQEALRALLDAAQQSWADEEQEDEEEAQLADALELLLLAVQGPVLDALAQRTVDGHAVRAHALLAFVHACEQWDDDTGRPLVLDWYARATTDGSKEDEHLATLWRTALNERARTSQALDVLRSWVCEADTDPSSESALAALLPALATTATDRRRISHLLRTVHNADGSVPQVAERLLAAVSTHPQISE